MEPRSLEVCLESEFILMDLEPESLGLAPGFLGAGLEPGATQAGLALGFTGPGLMLWYTAKMGALFTLLLPRRTVGGWRGWCSALVHSGCYNKIVD